MKISKERTFKFIGELFFRRIYDKTFVYKFISTETEVLSSKKPKKSEEQGICLESNINQFKCCGTFKPTSKNVYCLYDKGFTILRFDGWNWNETHLSEHPYDDFVSKVVTRKNFVKLDFCSHMAFDLKGNPIPIAIPMDYIEAQLNNRYYNLDKLLKIFLSLERTDIVVHGGIKDIPYYNSEPGRDKYLAVTWTPTKQAYKKVWQKALSYKSDYPSTKIIQAIFDLDILGAKKAQIRDRGRL